MQLKKRKWLPTIMLVGAGLTCAVVTIAAQSRIQTGADISPVPLKMHGLNPALVREGSYIVNAHGGCNDCHTAPSYVEGGNPFLGEPEVINAACYLAGGAPFGPGITSRNLTPRANGLPAGRTLEQFKELMRTGTLAGGNGHILQVMPWPVYGKMSDRDLEAIYEFLRAIPSLSPRPPYCGPPPA